MASKGYGKYQHFVGNPIAKPPCRMLNAQMYGFFVQGEEHAIQFYIDSTLNSVAHDAFRFSAIGSLVMLTFTDIENIASKVPPFSDYGWMQETDVIVWLPVAKLDKSSNKLIHLYWFPAFITVNNINALINGRETWGYNKYLCRYEMPTLGHSQLKFSLSLETFQPYSPQSKMAWHTLLEINPTSEQESWLDELADFGGHVFELLNDVKSTANPSWSLLKQFFNGFVHPQMDQILFKQFPDGEAENAVYKAVMHSPSIITKIHKIGLIKQQFELIVHQIDAFPLDVMFGIKLGCHKLDTCFSVLMDFEQLPASEI